MNPDRKHTRIEDVMRRDEAEAVIARAHKNGAQAKMMKAASDYASDLNISDEEHTKLGLLIALYGAAVAMDTMDSMCEYVMAGERKSRGPKKDDKTTN